MTKLGNYVRTGNFPGAQPVDRLSTLFLFVPTNYTNTTGTIYVRVTVNGQRSHKKTTGIKVLRKDWDSRSQQINTRATGALALNARLNAIKAQFYTALNALISGGEIPTSQKVMDYAMGNQREYKTLKSLFERYVNEKAITSGNSAQTIKNYHKYFRAIQIHLGGSGDIVLSDIREETLLGLFKVLIEKHAHNYAVKIARFFRTLVDYAVGKDLLPKSPLNGVSLKNSGIYDTTHLSQEQLQAWREYDFCSLNLPVKSIGVLNEERDAFVFCCYTGLHHADYSLRQFEIISYRNRNWIRGYRVKSNERYEMPLHPIAKEIIDKYEGVKNLPVRNNAERNIVLKKISAYVGIDISVSTKTARKTFTDYCKNYMGYSDEIIAKLLGHKSTHFVRYYGDITSRSIDEVVKF